MTHTLDAYGGTIQLKGKSTGWFHLSVGEQARCQTSATGVFISNLSVLIPQWNFPEDRMRWQVYVEPLAEAAYQSSSQDRFSGVARFRAFLAKPLKASAVRAYLRQLNDAIFSNCSRALLQTCDVQCANS